MAKRKLDLLESAEMWYIKEEEQKEKEEGRKEKEEERKEKEEERKERKQLFDEWERVQENIRKLRKDLKGLSNEEDELTKQDIKDDISRLMRKKKELADLLELFCVRSKIYDHRLPVY